MSCPLMTLDCRVLDLTYTSNDCIPFFSIPRFSSQAGGGNWGQSDEVVVKARNGVVVAETERALSEGCRKIMVMYGGLHMQVGHD